MALRIDMLINTSDFNPKSYNDCRKYSKITRK